MQQGTAVLDINHKMNQIYEYAFNNVGNTVGTKWLSVLGKTMEFANEDRAKRKMDKDLEIDLNLLDKVMEQL